ncbi:MAG: hypothetical protein HOM25_06500 [Rhodospirillaceae bacterium]|nr:hypothetical protein [Rhodospirillaceae bacterium]MBT5667322.1 hypothetical protein [Rhodospirillaceae bacterium]MBT5812404.1 hypothetical protein [Rhodospirillaceae bacterium]
MFLKTLHGTEKFNLENMASHVLRVLRFSILFFFASMLTACVTAQLPKPTISYLKPNAKYFIKSIEIDGALAVKSKTILGHFQRAMRNLPMVGKPVGEPMTLQVTVTNVHDVTPGEALWVGGINSISANFLLLRAKDNKRMYEIPLYATSANYAPGGILGLIAEASSDDEPKLAKALVEKMRKWVLVDNELDVQWGAVENSTQIAATSTPMSGADKSETHENGRAVASISKYGALKGGGSNGGERTGEVLKTIDIPTTVQLPNGEHICDISGNWEAIFSFEWEGLHTGNVSFIRKGRTFTGTSTSDILHIKSGDVVFKGNLKNKDFSNVQAFIQQDAGKYVESPISYWRPVRGNIKEDCNVIEVEASNVEMILYKVSDI